MRLILIAFLSFLCHATATSSCNALFCANHLGVEPLSEVEPPLSRDAELKRLRMLDIYSTAYGRLVGPMPESFSKRVDRLAALVEASPVTPQVIAEAEAEISALRVSVSTGGLDLNGCVSRLDTLVHCLLYLNAGSPPNEASSFSREAQRLATSPWTATLTAFRLVADTDPELDPTRKGERQAEARREMRGSIFLWLADHPRYADSRWVLAEILLNSAADLPAVEIEERMRSKQRMGETVDPWLWEIVQAAGAIDAGWRARGHDWAHNVPADDMRKFDQCLSKARGHFLRAHELRPDRAEALGGLAQVAALGCSTEPRSARYWFERSFAIDPRSPVAHAGILTALDNRWGGTYEDQVAFAEWCFEHKDNAESLTMALEVVRSRYQNGSKVFPDKRFYQVVRRLLDDFLARPARDFDRDALMTNKAVLAMLAGDAQTVREVLSLPDLRLFAQELAPAWGPGVTERALLCIAADAEPLATKLGPARSMARAGDPRMAAEMFEQILRQDSHLSALDRRIISVLRFDAYASVVFPTGNPVLLPLQDSTEGWVVTKGSVRPKDGLIMLTSHEGVFPPGPTGALPPEECELVLPFAVGRHFELEFDLGEGSATVYWGLSSRLQDDSEDDGIKNRSCSPRSWYDTRSAPPWKRQDASTRPDHFRLVVWDLDWALYVNDNLVKSTPHSRWAGKAELQDEARLAKTGVYLQVRFAHSQPTPASLGNFTVRKLLYKPAVVESVYPPNRPASGS